MGISKMATKIKTIVGEVISGVGAVAAVVEAAEVEVEEIKEEIMTTHVEEEVARHRHPNSKNLKIKKTSAAGCLDARLH